MSEEAIQEPGELDAAQAEDLEDSATSTGAEETEANEAEDSTEDSTAKPKPKGAQKRISELTASWRGAERDRDHWRDLFLQTQKPAETPKAVETRPPPTLESLGYDEAKYQAEMGEWVQEQVDRRLTAKERDAATKRMEGEARERERTFMSRSEKFAEKNPDYWDVAHADDLPVSQAMAEIIQDSEKGVDVLYHLGKNPDIAARIYQLSPTQAALEIGRLEAKLSLPQPKKHSNAPPPINTLSGNGETVSKDPDQMSMKEWLAWREKNSGK